MAVSDGIIELLITIDALRHASARRVTAVLPTFCVSHSMNKPITWPRQGRKRGHNRMECPTVCTRQPFHRAGVLDDNMAKSRKWKHILAETTESGGPFAAMEVGAIHV